MKPVAWPREDPQKERLLWLDPEADTFGDGTVSDLRKLPAPGDLLVVNDAATLPASLPAHTHDGEVVEVRLVAPIIGQPDTWRCVVFGAGDWRTKTELRPRTPALLRGAVLELEEIRAEVVARESGRVFTLRFDRGDDRFWSAIYRVGRPVQYAYVDAPLSLFHVQTSYASRPWASEMPSAGRPLEWSLLLGLRERGVGLARVTHAAGLSSIGDPTLDATLPWPERFDVPDETVRAVAATRRSGGRVIAVGTSVVRALEGAAAAHDGHLVAGEGTTNLVIGPGFVPRVACALFTGLHEATASHFALLRSFAPLSLLERAYAHAEGALYQGHEFGDSCLILNGVRDAYPTSR